MFSLQDASIEWALLHVENFYDSDFYPKLFEFDAIKHDWKKIKSYISGLDLEKYTSRTPYLSLALKPNGNFRIVHQLEPIDSIIYTAILYENAAIIENFRIPAKRKIACSYRIKPDVEGSYFERDVTGYKDFIQRAEDLANEFEDGFVLVCDIADFYNQIYLHRVNNIFSEAGSTTNEILETFLKGLNTSISRGIPVGPAPSILIAESIMADIDKKILTETANFVRYVDDVYIFLSEESEAVYLLHSLSKYLHETHRLVLSSEKTKVLNTADFTEKYIKEEERTEKAEILKELEEISSGPYGDPTETAEFEDLENDKKLELRSKAYYKLFSKSLKLEQLDLSLTRHILKQSSKYRIRSIIPLIFRNFTKLLPAVREMVQYFDKVLSKSIVLKYESEFKNLLKHPLLQLPYINIWVFTLFQNKHFNSVKIKINYTKIIRIREKALIALREENSTWIKDSKSSIDALGPWDKRAVYYASQLLSKDEAVHWLGLESSKSDILNQAICSFAISRQKAKKVGVIK